MFDHLTNEELIRRCQDYYSPPRLLWEEVCRRLEENGLGDDDVEQSVDEAVRETKESVVTSGLTHKEWEERGQ